MGEGGRRRSGWAVAGNVDQVKGKVRQTLEQEEGLSHRYVFINAIVDRDLGFVKNAIGRTGLYNGSERKRNCVIEFASETDYRHVLFRNDGTNH